MFSSSTSPPSAIWLIHRSTLWRNHADRGEPDRASGSTVRGAVQRQVGSSHFSFYFSNSMCRAAIAWFLQQALLIFFCHFLFFWWPNVLQWEATGWLSSVRKVTQTANEHRGSLEFHLLTSAMLCFLQPDVRLGVGLTESPSTAPCTERIQATDTSALSLFSGPGGYVHFIYSLCLKQKNTKK